MSQVNNNQLGNGNGNGYQAANDLEQPHSPNSSGKEGGNNGASVYRTTTAGGHIANDDLLAIGNSHRKIANPLPLGAMSFATTTLILSLYNVGVDGIALPNAIVCYSLFYGGLMQYFAGLWEFASGNTLGATIFCSYGLFWFGFSMLFVPWFGLVGTYNGVPNVYATGGPYEAEFTNAVGLYLWVWFGITTTFMFAAARSSITLVVLLFVLDLTFGLLGGYYYTLNTHLQTAGGAMGIVTAIVAFYLAMGSLFSKETCYFTVPLGSLARNEDI